MRAEQEGSPLPARRRIPTRNQQVQIMARKEGSWLGRDEEPSLLQGGKELQAMASARHADLMR